MDHEAFVQGNYDTKFVEQLFKPKEDNLDDEEALVAAVIASSLNTRSQLTGGPVTTNGTTSRWRQARTNLT
jgi:hypothetical protein